MDKILIVGFVFIFISYFIGSWPVGRSVGKFFANVEIQEGGSGKGGMSNAWRRTKDKMIGVVVLIVDGGVKGAFWIFAVYIIFGTVFNLYWVVYACFAAVLLGHIFPALTNFKTGGAGIAILIGGPLVLVPGFAYALGIIAWLVTFHLSQGVRFLCNIVSVSVLLLTGVAFNFSWSFLGFAFFAIALTSLAHRQNFCRLRHGKEQKSKWEDIGKGF